MNWFSLVSPEWGFRCLISGYLGMRGVIGYPPGCSPQKNLVSGI